MGRCGGSEWREYYDAAGDEPRATLLYALEQFDTSGADRLAVDLGCGTGRDTAELLRRGWRVLAIDGEAEAIDRLRARRDLPPRAWDRLQTQVTSFEDAEWPDAEIVNSSFALPFCPPHVFPTLWRRIVESLRPGGRFCGQLFGDRDGWSSDDGMTFHTRSQVDALLGSLEVEQFEELEEDGTTATGKNKHWHVFHIVGRMPGR